jgi:hypothetical protein
MPKVIEVLFQVQAEHDYSSLLFWLFGRQRQGINSLKPIYTKIVGDPI